LISAVRAFEGAAPIYISAKEFPHMVESLEQENIDACSVIDAGRSEPYAESSKLYLQALLNACASGAAVLNECGTILYVNGAWRQFAAQHGLVADLDVIGLDYLEVCRNISGASVVDADAIADGIGQILLGREPEYHKEYYCHPLVTGQCVLIHAARLDLPRDFRVLVTYEYAPLNKQAVEARRKEEERLRLLLETANILPWEADAESGRFTYVGEQSVRMLGYPVEQWYEPDFWSVHLHPDDRERAVFDCLKSSRSLDSYELEYRMLARDGRTVWLHNVVSVIRRDGQPTTIRGFLMDVTERKQTEEALRDLSGKLINAQEEERKRVARELHDDLNQRMALLSIELAQLEQKIQKPADLHQLIQHLQTKAQEISAEIHRLSYRLHPSKLDHLGLAAAVRSLCQELSGSEQIKIEFHQTGFPATLSKDVTLCVFRIAQESLRNSIKHSGALHARVLLENAARAIRLTVSDDGCGFNLDSSAMKKGLGFTSMRERLRLVSGDMQIYSQPLGGTRIDISVPLTGENETDPESLYDY
jgi:PAS domain S-box-containing protein